jgi:hypothetical protein
MSAPNFSLSPMSRVSACSPEERETASKPASPRTFSTNPWIASSSSTTRTTDDCCTACLRCCNAIDDKPRSEKIVPAAHQPLCQPVAQPHQSDSNLCLAADQSPFSPSPDKRFGKLLGWVKNNEGAASTCCANKLQSMIRKNSRFCQIFLIEPSQRYRRTCRLLPIEWRSPRSF